MYKVKNQWKGGRGTGVAGLNCSLSSEREQVFNSLENTQKSTKKSQIEQLEFQRWGIFILYISITYMK